jgi:methionyl-tRNA formyltransferase
MISKKILYMGTPEYATIILDSLIKHNYEIVGLFTQPDKKVGREQLITPPHIKQYCINHNYHFPIYQPDALKGSCVVDVIKSLNPDFIIVAAYGQILPKNILEIAPCINLHASLLPKYRGASPIQKSILNNDGFTGVTAMMMEEGLDSGDILGFKYFELKRDTDVEELFNILSTAAANLIIEVLERFDYLLPLKQNDTQVSFCGKITKNDGLISFYNSEIFYSRYKAYKIWPGIFLESGLKIKNVNFEENRSSNREGEILEIRKDSIVLGCTKGSLVLFEVQAPSKKVMNIIDYIRGSRLLLGDILF